MVTYEFFGRAEWRALRETYGLGFATQRSMDSSLMYQAVAQGNVDVISAFSTDGRISALDLLIIEDDRGAIPPYDAVIIASAGLQHRHPEAIDALRRLVGKIDGDTMRPAESTCRRRPEPQSHREGLPPDALEREVAMPRNKEPAPARTLPSRITLPLSSSD